MTNQAKWCCCSTLDEGDFSAGFFPKHLYGSIEHTSINITCNVLKYLCVCVLPWDCEAMFPPRINYLSLSRPCDYF